ncbi:MAG: hypothetical protein KC766_16010 [Myxococcales bacterium]|nr:hypothetical protein [Myxococcales bacterium]
MRRIELDYRRVVSGRAWREGTNRPACQGGRHLYHFTRELRGRDHATIGEAQAPMHLLEY